MLSKQRVAAYHEVKCDYIINKSKRGVRNRNYRNISFAVDENKQS